uniref:Macro domain-containing protein n=1 Tax=Athene cunicularia TaxID=194338 RepID=A0A663N9A1_ATHCN
MPDPVGVPLDPYIWQFLQRQAELIQDINQEMAICHCELKWPQTDCAHPEIVLCPSSSLSEKKKPMIKLIKTWKQDASKEEQYKDERFGNKDRKKLCYKRMLPDGVLVAVYKADLCAYPVDVVVNASNEDLKPIGGLAEALLKAAGPELQQECDELVRKNGTLLPGCAVITGAGKLPCKNVIHAVGPRWREDEAERCVFLLRKTVKKSLQLAETYNHHSIALPVISGGSFDFPLQMYADSIVSSIKETLEESMGDSSLKEVHLVDVAEETVQVLSKTVKNIYWALEKQPHGRVHA